MLKGKNPTIAIVDSGIGGVSVLKQLIAKYNGGNFIYFADNLYMPYGNKNKIWLKNRIEEIIGILQDRYNVDYIIIACNTASSVLDTSEYKNLYCMPFQEGVTYLATKLTKQNLHNIDVIADRYLANLIEKYILDEKKLKDIVKRKTKKYQLMNKDRFILGCTHYELVNDIFKENCPNTEVINNSSFLIEKTKINIQQMDLNIVVLLSKEDEMLKEKILAIIRG